MSSGGIMVVLSKERYISKSDVLDDFQLFFEELIKPKRIGKVRRQLRK